MRTRRIIVICAAVMTAAAMFGCSGSDGSTNEAVSDAGGSSAEVTEAQRSAETESAAAQTTAAAAGADEVTTTAEPDPEERVRAEAQLLLDSAEGAGLPESIENKTVRRLAHTELDPAADENAPLPSTELFRLKYGGSVETETVSADEQYDRLAAAVMSNESPDIFPTDDMNAFPKGAVTGLFAPIEGCVDLGSELWRDAQEGSGYFTFGGVRYAAVVEAVPRYVCVYSRDTISANGLEDPAALYAQGEWTHGWFETLCTRFSDAAEGRYALDGSCYQKALSESSGVPLLTCEGGLLVSNLENAQLAQTQSWMYSLAQQGVCFDQSENNWQPREAGLSDGKTLFVPAELGLLTGSSDEAERFRASAGSGMMFLPMPREQRQYMSARLRGYFLCAGAPNPSGAGAYLDCLKLAAEKDRSAEKERLAVKLGWSSELTDMLDECYRLAETAAVIDCSEGMPAEQYNSLFRDTLDFSMLQSGYGGSWEDTVSELRKQTDYAVAALNDPEPIGP